MMRSALILTFALLLIAPTPAQQKPAKLADLHAYDDSLFAEGVWRADNLNDQTENAFPSVTRLECYKRGGRDLVGSDAYCMQASAQIAFGHPDIGVVYYPVIVWDKNKVIAADSPTAPFPICIWSQLTINLHDHSIMATDTRKLGKGHEGFGNSCEAEPLAQTYHLVDSTEEFARKDLRAIEAARKAEGANGSMKIPKGAKLAEPNKP